nr:uncharacterized protein LOC107261010 [Ipomoea batatas]
MAWVLLKNEYEGNDKTKRMQVLNLKREFEMQKMKETESLKDYTERLKKVVNKIRLLREELPDDRVVEKILTFFMHLKLKNNEGPTGMKVTLREHSKQMSQNLLSVGQLLEKGYSVIFKNNMCFITDSCGAELFSVKMKDKSFCLDWDEAGFKAYPCVVSQVELWHKS